MNTCLICDAQEQEGTFDETLHDAVKHRCAYCPREIYNPDSIKECVNESRPLSHRECYTENLKLEIQTKTFPLMQHHLDYINSEILGKKLPFKLDLESLYGVLRSLQQTAANVSIAIARQKDEIKIAQVVEYRERKENEREQTKEEKRLEEERKALIAKERADPMLKIRRKSIEGFMKIGMSREDAEKYVDTNMPKAN